MISPVNECIRDDQVVSILVNLCWFEFMTIPGSCCYRFLGIQNLFVVKKTDSS